MSDDLVHRLEMHSIAAKHYMSKAHVAVYQPLMLEAKSRIEELEQRCNDLAADKIDLRSENMELKAKLTEAVEDYYELVNQWSDYFEDEDESDRTWSSYVTICLKQLGKTLKGERR